MRYVLRWLKRPEGILLTTALLIGVFLRLYKIDTIPFGTNHDGAWSTLWAIELSQKPLPLQVYFHHGWLGEAMPRYIMAIVVKIFGPTILAERLGMTVFTLAALPVFYLLVKKLFSNSLLAFFSTVLLTTSGWDITFAKTGWRTSAVPVFEIATIYLLWQSIKTKKTTYFALTGIVLALTLNTYNAAQFVPATIVGWLMFSLYKQRKVQKTLPQLAVFAISFLIVIAPLASYALNHWDNFKGRNDFLFVGNRIIREGNFHPFVDNLKKVALMYHVHGGGDDFFIREPLLDFPTNYLFLLGLLIGVFRIQKHTYQFLFFWFLTALMPSLAGTPNGSHAIGTLPPVYIFAGLGLLSTYRFLITTPFKKYYLPQFSVTLILVSALVTTFTLYLGPKRRELWGFYPETTVVGNYMKPLIKTTDFYLTDNYPRDALTLLTYQGGDAWIKHYTWFEKKEDFLTVVLKARDTSFIMSKTQQNEPIVAALQTKYPGGSLSELRYRDDNINRPAAWVFTVPKSGLVL